MARGLNELLASADTGQANNVEKKEEKKMHTNRLFLSCWSFIAGNEMGYVSFAAKCLCMRIFAREPVCLWKRVSSVCGGGKGYDDHSVACA